MSQDDRSEVGKVYTIIFKLKVMKKNISFKGVGSAGFVLIACFILALAIFHYVLGNPANFMNNDPNNQPIPGNLMGTIYKGGMIVPVIQTLLLTVLVLSVERFFAIRKARGRGNLSQFIRKVKESDISLSPVSASVRLLLSGLPLLLIRREWSVLTGPKDGSSKTVKSMNPNAAVFLLVNICSLKMITNG